VPGSSIDDNIESWLDDFLNVDDETMMKRSKSTPVLAPVNDGAATPKRTLSGRKNRHMPYSVCASGG
jgi:hypothetical protein